MKQKLTLRYTCQQIMYWAAAAGVMSFASAFLLEKGFAASQVGLILASGNLLSCAVQPILADRADRAGAHLVTRYIAVLTALCIAFFAALQFIPMPQWMFGLLYLMGIFTFDAMMPLLNAVVVAYNEQNYYINFGLSRGIGSFAFSLAALAIGKVIAGWGADWMLWIVISLLAVNLVFTLGFPKLNSRRECGIELAQSCSVPVFFARYRWYCVSLLGIMLLAMFHAMSENYLIKIMERIGGDSSNVGVALFVATVVEMPILIFLDNIRRRVKDNLLLKIGGLSFLLKAVLFMFAPNVNSIYIVQLLQATSYTFISPIQLYYASAKVADEDMVKGQAFITASYTLGCAMGNFAGGQLLDAFNVPVMLAAGIAMATLGTAILFITVEKKDKYILQKA